MVYDQLRQFRLLLVALILTLLLLLTISPAWSQPATEGYWYQVRAIEAADLGLSNPIGLAYSPVANLFFALEEEGESLIAFTPYEDQVGVNQMASAAANPLNVAYYEPTAELFSLDQPGQSLSQLQIGPEGEQAPTQQSIRQFSAARFGLRNAQGITFDVDGGRLFVLDAVGPAIVRIQASEENDFGAAAQVQRTLLPSLAGVALRGIAFNPVNGHLYVSGLAEQKLYEVTTGGQLISTYDLAELNLRDPQGMVFAPSADKTDDPDIHYLYLADSGRSDENPNNGHIVEISFQEVIAPTAVNVPASLVNTIDTSKPAWNPSSPDPAALAYFPDSRTLLVTDSEVEEAHPDFQGVNLYESSRAGALLSTCDTLDYSNEPTGAAVNPANGHIFISDDNNDAVYEINPRSGGYCNGDETISSINTLSMFGSEDSTGLAYGGNKLYIVDGVNTQVYILNLGGNGVIGGGDDSNGGSFDTLTHGIRDPEGLEYNPDSNTLFISSQHGGDRFILETTLSGALVNTYNIAFLGSISRAGLAYGQGSQGGGSKSLYIASRGVDNGQDPNENDGKIYEVALGTSNPPPSAEPIYISTTINGAQTIGNLSGVRDEDIIFFNGNNWELFFDGSDVGLAKVDVNAFYRVNANTILLSFDKAIALGSLGSVKPQDIVQFNATSLGNNTAGSFTLLFDGSDVGLTTTAENIDAVNRLADGRLLISTKGTAAVPGLKGQNRDVLAFTPSSLGENTAGSWAMYFDGSDVALAAKGENIDGLHVANGVVYLSTTANFAVPGLSGNDKDVFVCNSTSLGDNTACNYQPALFFRGSDWLVAKNDVDGMSIP